MISANVSFSPLITTFHTELRTTSAAHIVVSSFNSLNPELTTYALSKILALKKIDDCRKVFFNFRINLILLTSNSYMLVCSAIKTVVLLTHRALKFKIIFLVLLIKGKNVFAVRIRALWAIFLLFKCILELEFGKLVVIIWIQNILDVEITKSYLAFWQWTSNWELWGLNLKNNELLHAFCV
jgi:hypothetical protein